MAVVSGVFRQAKMNIIIYDILERKKRNGKEIRALKQSKLTYITNFAKLVFFIRYETPHLPGRFIINGG